MPSIYRWQDKKNGGSQLVAITRGPKACIADGLVLVDGEAPFGATFRVRYDGAWRVFRVSVTVIGLGSIDLRHDRNGGWARPEGTEWQPIETLQGATEFDLGVTPFTNTLALRRLALDVGASAEVEAVVVSLPDLAVTRETQRYTRQRDREWRCESGKTGFARDLTVDEEGYVLDFTGLFKRVSDAPPRSRAAPERRGSARR